MGDQDEWGQTGYATEMGATVVPDGRVQFRYHCTSCDVKGQLYDSADDAQREGLQHEHSVHPRVYQIEQLGSY